MGYVDQLVEAYRRFVSLPWDQNLAGPQRVWFCIYPPREERRVRHRLGEFELETNRAGHGWTACDITAEFSRWMGAHEYREEYFRSPEDVDLALDDFAEHLEATVHRILDADANLVVAVVGVGSLFGVGSVSRLVGHVADAVRGRLLVFFPGEREGNNYRLLDARDGWNYLAVPIEVER
jgi:hypothetical protein